MRSLLRGKRLYDEVQTLATELARLNRTLESRVEEETARNMRLSRLKRFVSPQLADLIVAGDADDPLVSHRREIAVVYIDLRGFTTFAETTEPELVMDALRDYHRAMGRIIQEFGGTLERFTGDGMMLFFNDPVTIDDPAGRAIETAIAIQREAMRLAAHWRRHGFDLAAGVGVALGFATLGAIGFEEHIDYGAIGTVTNLAARLCGEAQGAEILVSQRVMAALDGAFAAEPAGELSLKGFHKPVPAFRLRAG